MAENRQYFGLRIPVGYAPRLFCVFRHRVVAFSKEQRRKEGNVGNVSEYGKLENGR